MRDESLYLGKALLDALFLTLENLAVPKQLSNSKATMTLMGMYYPTFVLQTAISGYHAIIVAYIHISVGFGVARFDN